MRSCSSDFCCSRFFTFQLKKINQRKEIQNLYFLINFLLWLVEILLLLLYFLNLLDGPVGLILLPRLILLLYVMSQFLCWVHLMMAVGWLQGVEVVEDPSDVGHPVRLWELARGDHRPEELHHTVQVPGVLDILGQHQDYTRDVVIASSSFGFLNISLQLVAGDDYYGWIDCTLNSTLYWGSFLLTLRFCLWAEGCSVGWDFNEMRELVSSSLEPWTRGISLLFKFSS